MHILSIALSVIPVIVSASDVIIEKPAMSRSLFRTLLDEKNRIEQSSRRSSMSNDLRVRIFSPEHEEKRFIAELDSMRK